LALAELDLATGSTDHTDLIRAAITYERSWFDSDRLNWPDLRDFTRANTRGGKEPSFPVFWCHGALGIGLARVRLFEIMSRNDDAAEAEACLITALRLVSELERAGTPFDMSPCHGLGGVVELLLEAARVFRQSELADRARETLALGLELAGSDTGPWPCGVPDGGENPSLMVGTAGIGHVFLRAADPTTPGLGLLYSRPMDAQRIIVKLSTAKDASDLQQRAEELAGSISNARLVRISRRGRIIIRIPGDAPVEAILSQMNQSDDVEYAELDVIDKALG
jgi:hypothetical protein